MTNSIEKVRIESDGESQGGWVEFDWSTGTMKATWDDGGTETWTRRGCDMKSQSLSFFLFTDQLDRYALTA